MLKADVLSNLNKGCENLRALLPSDFFTIAPTHSFGDYFEVNMKTSIFNRFAIAMISLMGSITVPSHAEQFFVQGKINTTLSTGSDEYGGCMIQLSNPIGNGCPDKGWVSLDCNDDYYDGGERRYASALMAFSLDKPVYVQVDNQVKQGEFCVAKRIDVVRE